MSILNDLVAQIEDAALRERISKEVDKLAKQKKFVCKITKNNCDCS